MVALSAEAWIWYACAAATVFSRFAARFAQYGSMKKYQLEDTCMIIVAFLYTAEVVLLVEAADTPTNLVAPQDLGSLTDASIKQRIFGSKLIIALEMIFCATQWGCKACLLLMYSNLTFGLGQHLAVKLVAIYAAIGYVVMITLYLSLWCHPFHEYWSVPATNPQCSTYLHHLTTNIVLNISSDLLIILIPIPLLMRMKLPTGKKILLCCLFSLGLFVILSAVLNKYYSFTDPYGNRWVYWYVREISTAVIVSNIPHAWVLVRKLLRIPKFFNKNDNEGPPFARKRGGCLKGRSPRIIGQSVGNSWGDLEPTIGMNKSGTYRSRTNRSAMAQLSSKLGGTQHSTDQESIFPVEIWESGQFLPSFDGTSPDKLEELAQISRAVRMKRRLEEQRQRATESIAGHAYLGQYEELETLARPEMAKLRFGAESKRATDTSSDSATLSQFGGWKGITRPESALGPMMMSKPNRASKPEMMSKPGPTLKEQRMSRARRGIQHIGAQRPRTFLREICWSIFREIYWSGESVNKPVDRTSPNPTAELTKAGIYVSTEVTRPVPNTASLASGGMPEDGVNVGTVQMIRTTRGCAIWHNPR